MTEPTAANLYETATRGLVSFQPAGSSRAVIYLRVSTTEQAETDFGNEGFSLPAQRDAARRRAHEMGAVVVDEYIDRGESARSADRPALQTMLQRLRLARDVDYVIVHKLDRLARSREDDVTIVMDIRAAGAQLVSVSENIDETPSGMLVHGIMATIAEFYSRNLSVEASKGLEQKAKMGGTIGLAPIGYLNTRSTVEGRNIGTVVVDEERAPLVRWAFEAFATGEWTISTLTEELGNRGLLLRPTKRCPAKPLARSRVAKMLRCPYYVGIVTYKGALHPGRHPALIDPELFEQVQTVLDQRSLGKERPVKRTHYLKGILACGRCGRQLSLSHNVGNMGVRYPYFFCLGRHGSKPNGCDLPFLPMAQVEVDVEKFWSRVRIAEHELRCIRTDVTDLITLGSSQHEGDIAVQRDRLVRLDGEEAKLLQAHYADAVSLSLLKKEQARIRGERNRAESLISSLSLEFAAMQHTLDEALTRVERCDEVYRAGSQQIRRELCFALFERIFIDDTGVSASNLSTPYAHILSPDRSERIERERQALQSGSYGRLLDQAEGEKVGVDVDEELRDLLTPAFAEFERPNGLTPMETVNPGSLRSRGLNVTTLVGLRGFEPPTP